MLAALLFFQYKLAMKLSVNKILIAANRFEKKSNLFLSNNNFTKKANGPENKKNKDGWMEEFQRANLILGSWDKRLTDLKSRYDKNDGQVLKNKRHATLLFSDPPTRPKCSYKRYNAIMRKKMALVDAVISILNNYTEGEVIPDEEQIRLQSIFDKVYAFAEKFKDKAISFLDREEIKQG